MSERALGAVLLDMDGLLVDTEPLWTIAEHELAARLGGEFTPEMKTAMIGKGIDTAVPILLEMLGRADVDPRAAGEILLERAAALFREPGAVVRQPGADDLLDALADAGIPAALVSSSFRVLMDPVLGVLGASRFTATVAGDEVTRRKPDPEPYLRAASLLHADPARCVVLEDSTAGAHAGLAAGCPVVFVPSIPAMPPVPAATTVGSLHDVTLDLLDALANGHPAAAATPGGGLLPGHGDGVSHGRARGELDKPRRIQRILLEEIVQDSGGGLVRDDRMNHET